MLKTTLFIPTFNEIDGVRAIMPQVNLQWADEIIVVDGGSTDGTREYFQAMGIPVHDQDAPQLSGAYKKCLEICTGDVMVAFSPDNNSVPANIPLLLAKVQEGADIAISSRYLGDAKSEDDDVVTAFGNWLFTTLINVLFRAHFTDTLVMYRAFRIKLVKELDLDLSQPCWETQMMIRSAKNGFKICEIPGDEPARIGGVRKLRPLYHGYQVLKVILQEFFRR